MKIDELEKILKNEAKDSNVTIISKEYPSGYWLNQIDKNWITQRFFVKPNTNIKFGKLVKSINKLNRELVKSDKSHIEIILKK